MANLINDTLNFGFGLFAYSRDKIEKMVEKMVDAGKIERRDAHDFAHDMIAAGEEQRKEVRQMVRDTVRNDLREMGITGSGAPSALTADDIRRIVREEIAAAKGSSKEPEITIVEE